MSSSSRTNRAERRSHALTWGAVVFVGATVIGLVLALQLFPRLTSGNRVLDGARPIFTDDHIAGNRAGIAMVSTIVNLADPLVTDTRTPAEVKGLITFVSKQSGLSEAQVVAALQAKFPHTLALLQSLPLQSVSEELPALIGYVSSHSGLSSDAVMAAVKTTTPHLAQAIAALPVVTSGWNNIPGTEGLTRFDGSAAQTVPQMRDYLANDVVATAEGQRDNFQKLDSWPGLLVIVSVVMTIGVIALLFGLLVLNFNRNIGLLHATPNERRKVFWAWAIVTIVGVLVLLMLPVFQLFGRLDSGSQVLDNLRPVLTDTRVAGDVAGVQIISKIVDTADPIVLAAGGAAAEVPKLVNLIATATSQSPAQVVGALQASFPHTFSLLNAIPLESVNAELPGLTAFLASTLKATPEQLTAALQANFPRLAQSVANLPAVVGGWAAVPGTENLTRYDGSGPVRSVPQIRDYFAIDVVPAVASVRADFQEVDRLPPPVNWVPPILLVAGILVVYYGAIMMYIWRPRPRSITTGDYSGAQVGAAAPSIWA